MYFKYPEQDGIELQERNTDGFDNTMEALLPTLHQQRTYDYVLVADQVEDQEHPKFLKQIAFIDHLRKKNMKLTAPKEIFDKYRYLLKVSDACNWSGDQKCSIIPHSTRIRVVHYILHHTHINTGENLRELQEKGVFEAMFCLHERNKQKVLKQKWARWSALCTTQPVDDVRSYFGEKVALYYLWLGWYTILLVPAAILGVIVFLYALAFFNTSPLIKEVCESDTVMCPRCDKWCQVWQLRDTCTYAKVSHLFDNEGTVAFAMFMAVWGNWKRPKATFVSKWKVFDWCEEEEELILGVVNDPDCHPKEFRHSYLRSTLILVLVTLMLVLIIRLTQALVVFRVVAAVLLSEGTWEFVRDHANTVAVMLGAVLHYFTMQFMTRVNKVVAFKLCEIEKTQSFAATERSFTVKMFTFQFFTLFSSLIYVAFFLGRINGRPGSYVRISGKWRLEECHPSGCLTDLFIQMAVIMLLKQTLNNIFEFTVPWFKSYFRRTTTEKLERKCGHCYRNECREEEKMGHDPCDICKLRDWLRNYDLNDVNSFSLFNEFLEIVVQFSFTTIFVAAFPLAPLLALINNIFEIRLDAIKMVSLERRLVPKKTNDIGIWTKVLEAIGVLAVIANGLVIGVSSDFIPRLVYRYHYGPCANGEADVHCMKGYINDTLSTAHITDLNVRKDFFPSQLITESGFNVTQCSYKDYRNDVDYSLTSQFWLIMAVRFAFVVLFEHVVVIFKFIAAWFVPDSPMLVKNNRLKDKLSRLKEELQDMKYSKSTDV